MADSFDRDRNQHRVSSDHSNVHERTRFVNPGLENDIALDSRLLRQRRIGGLKPCQEMFRGFVGRNALESCLRERDRG